MDHVGLEAIRHPRHGNRFLHPQTVTDPRSIRWSSAFWIT